MEEGGCKVVWTLGDFLHPFLQKGRRGSVVLAGASQTVQEIIPLPLVCSPLMRVAGSSFLSTVLLLRDLDKGEREGKLQKEQHHSNNNKTNNNSNYKNLLKPSNFSLLV